MGPNSFLVAWWVPVEMFMSPMLRLLNNNAPHLYLNPSNNRINFHVCVFCAQGCGREIGIHKFLSAFQFSPMDLHQRNTLLICWMVVVRVFWHPPKNYQCRAATSWASVPASSLHLFVAVNQSERTTLTTMAGICAKSKGPNRLWRINSDQIHHQKVAIKLQSRKRYPVY